MKKEHGLVMLATVVYIGAQFLCIQNGVEFPPFFEGLIVLAMMGYAQKVQKEDEREEMNNRPRI